jgi:hypothetical protein
MWDDLTKIEDQLFIPSTVEVDVKVEYLDLPGLHCFGEGTEDEFLDALADTEDLNLFNYKSI